MRITLFTENYYRGGVDTFIATLINRWPVPEDEFTLMCNADCPGIKVIRDRLERPCTFATYDFTTYAGLARKTQANRFLDVLRIATSPLLRYLFLVRALFRLRTTFRAAGADRLVVINGGYPGGDACRAAGIAWGLLGKRPKAIHNFHNLASPPGRWARLQENLVDRLLAKYTRRFVTVSNAAARSMAERPGIPAEKVTYIYNGIEPPAPRSGTDIRAELGLPADTPLCLMLASYEPRKGHRFLLESFQRVVSTLPAAHFLICGHGSPEEVATVTGYVLELKLEANVHLLGFRGDAMALLPQADLLLVGSQEFESFGLTCVEAMSYRVPVVATQVGGLPEVVVDGEGGYCVGKDEVDLFAGYVLRLLMDQDLRQEQGERGFARYRELFTAPRMAQKYADLIRQEDTNPC